MLGQKNSAHVQQEYPVSYKCQTMLVNKFVPKHCEKLFVKEMSTRITAESNFVGDVTFKGFPFCSVVSALVPHG